MKTILSNLEKQLEQIIIDHKDDVENDTYWRGVKIGLEVCVNLIKERLANSAKQSESNYNISLVSQQSEQFYCNCSRAKGLDHDEDGMPYCIECQKPVQ